MLLYSSDGNYTWTEPRILFLFCYVGDFHLFLCSEPIPWTRCKNLNYTCNIFFSITTWKGALSKPILEGPICLYFHSVVFLLFPLDVLPVFIYYSIIDKRLLTGIAILGSKGWSATGLQCWHEGCCVGSCLSTNENSQSVLRHFTAPVFLYSFVKCRWIFRFLTVSKSNYAPDELKHSDSKR